MKFHRETLRKKTTFYVNSLAPKRKLVDNSELLKFFMLVLEKMPMEIEDFENPVRLGSILSIDTLLKNKDDENFSSVSSRTFKSSLAKESTNTNSFMKIKKDFNDRKSKLMKNDQKPMMFMHDC